MRSDPARRSNDLGVTCSVSEVKGGFSSDDSLFFFVLFVVVFFVVVLFLFCYPVYSNLNVLGPQRYGNEYQ